MGVIETFFTLRIIIRISLVTHRSKHFTHIIQWIIGGTRGGFNRARIIKALNDTPQNAHKLSQLLGVDYSTIRHHVEVMEKNGLLTSVGDRYGKLYFMSDRMLENYSFFEEIWEKIGKKMISNDEEK